MGLFSRGKNMAAGSECGLQAEEHFGEILRLERKRTERSGKPFLLALLDIEKLEAGEKDELLGKLPSVLAFTRQTDAKGWHRGGSVIGIVFTEIKGMPESIAVKLEGGLKTALGAGKAGRVSVSFHVFPEEYGGSEPFKGFDPELYPEIQRPGDSKRSRLIIKRIIDVAGSVLGLIIFSPLFVLIPLAIKISSGGPVLFRQERVGLMGRRFTFLKFRSMYVDCDANIHREYIKDLIGGKNGVGGGGVYKIKDDPRITPVGKILRKSSLDELPQFINVLRGDMSLVGPRPTIPYEMEIYSVWHRRRVLEVKPGITGLWQVKGRSSTSFDDMVRLDLKFASEWSLRLDIKLLFQTPWAVLTLRGAY